jgi:hypothetical protein
MDSNTATPPETLKAPPKPRESFPHLDVITLMSFIVGGTLGIGSLFHRIREQFHQTFVLGYNETATPFTLIIEKYNGKHGMPDRNNPSPRGEFDKLTFRRQSGQINPEEYTKQRGEIARRFKKDINDVLKTDYKIPTDNHFKDWTVGVWKRWHLLGNTSKVEVGLGFASLTAITVGAISMLRHNKRTMDGIEDLLTRPNDNTPAR